MPIIQALHRTVHRHRAILIVSVASVGMIASGCSGARPTLTSQAGSSQSVASGQTDDPVAELLRSPPSPFTARYTIQSTVAGSQPATAEVVVDGSRRRVTIRDVDFFVNADGETTCTPTGCVEGLQQGLVSDLGVAEGFWGPASASRLIGDIARRIGTLSHYNTDIVGATASCVDVPLAGTAANGSVSYCALTAGVLATYSGADSTITLTEYDQTVDPAKLIPPG